MCVNRIWYTPSSNGNAARMRLRQCKRVSLRCLWNPFIPTLDWFVCVSCGILRTFSHRFDADRKTDTQTHTWHLRTKCVWCVCADLSHSKFYVYDFANFMHLCIAFQSVAIARRRRCENDWQWPGGVRTVYVFFAYKLIMGRSSLRSVYMVIATGLGGCRMKSALGCPRVRCVAQQVNYVFRL